MILCSRQGVNFRDATKQSSFSTRPVHLLSLFLLDSLVVLLVSRPIVFGVQDSSSQSPLKRVERRKEKILQFSDCAVVKRARREFPLTIVLTGQPQGGGDDHSVSLVHTDQKPRK